MILYYHGKGVNHRGVEWLTLALHRAGREDLCPVTAVDLKNEEWEGEADLLIFPGGRDIPYDRALKGRGNERIRRYVERGGKYLGICAGAYYASGSVEFEKGNSLEVIESRELAFFPGTARGPAYGLGEYSYETSAGERMALVTLSGLQIDQSRVYYKGGSSFVDAEKYPTVSILGRFEELKGKPAAIISCAVERGVALLSAVHPEQGESQVLFECLLDSVMSNVSARSPVMQIAPMEMR